jgi:metallo-beta-lactamase family protein
VDGAKTVEVLGENIVVRAGIHTLGGFSAHADRDELLEWLSCFRKSPEIFIVHGEEQASKDFQEAVAKRFPYVTHIPEVGEEFEI